MINLATLKRLKLVDSIAQTPQGKARPGRAFPPARARLCAASRRSSRAWPPWLSFSASGRCCVTSLSSLPPPLPLPTALRGRGLSQEGPRAVRRRRAGVVVTGCAWRTYVCAVPAIRGVVASAASPPEGQTVTTMPAAAPSRPDGRPRGGATRPEGRPRGGCAWYLPRHQPPWTRRAEAVCRSRLLMGQIMAAPP